MVKAYLQHGAHKTAMSTELQILHITDCHLRADPAARLHGWPVAATFEAVLDDALARHPHCDALILGGDLVDDGSVAGYRWLNERLRRVPCPVLAMAGNHEAPATMARELDRASVHTPLAIGGWRIETLDSHWPGHEAGRLGRRQLDALEARLAAHAVPTLLCLHHPPCTIGTAWIDAIRLEDGPALEKIVARHPQVRALACGHAHQDAHWHFAGRPGWITPSTMRQFRPGAREFAEDPACLPGYRTIRLAADATVTTRVQRVPAAAAACG